MPRRKNEYGSNRKRPPPPTGTFVPCVWEQLSNGPITRVELPLASGATGGRVVGLGRRSATTLDALSYAVTPGAMDFYRPAVQTRTGGVWGAPQVLPPLAGSRDARPSGFCSGTYHAASGFTVVGHSYSELSAGNEIATIWQLEGDGDVSSYDLNTLSNPLPAGNHLMLCSNIPYLQVVKPSGGVTKVRIPAVRTVGGTGFAPGTEHACLLTSLQISVPASSPWPVALLGLALLVGGGAVVRTRRRVQ